MGHGIVTRIDATYFYVWSWGHGVKEFRCRKVPGKEFKHGESIYFTSPSENVETLDANRCERASRQLPIFPSKNCIWKAECLVTFAPKEFDVLKKIQDQLPNCKALAFSDEFCYVASFKLNTHIRAGEVYKSYVTRIPIEYNEWIPKLGTIFCVTDKHEKIYDKEKVRELLQKAPWTKLMSSENSRRNSSTSNNYDKTISEQIHPNSNLFEEQPYSEENIDKTEGESQNKYNLIKPNIFQLDNEFTNDIPKNLKQPTEEPENLENVNTITKIPQTILKKPGKEENDETKVYTGIVVEADDFGLIIWSRVHGLVRAPALPIIGLEKRWPISTWVNYRAFFDDTGTSLQQNNNVNVNRCQYTAYDLFTSDEKRQMECQLFGPVRYVGDDLMLVNEPLLGNVMCANDLRLVQRLEYGLAEYVIAFITFTKEYPDLCRWICLAIKCPTVDGVWVEIEKPLIAKPVVSEWAENNLKVLENNGENVEKTKNDERLFNESVEEEEEEEEEEIEQQAEFSSSFNAINLYSQKRSHHIHSISTGVCDFSSATTPSSISSTPLSNNNNNNLIYQSKDLIYWDEFDEDDNNNNENNLIKEATTTTTDDNEKFLFKSLNNVGLTEEEFCSFFMVQQEEVEEEEENFEEENIVQESSSIIPIQQQKTCEKPPVILPSFDASEIGSLTQIDFTPQQKQRLLPDFSVKEYANKYFNENGGEQDLIKL